MPDKVINRAADLMIEQAASYRRLDSLCAHLGGALLHGESEQVESYTRAGEKELLSLRARLAQITSALSSFAAMRAASPNTTPVSEQVRARFEAASKELIAAAESFQRTRARTTALAINGVAFSGAMIEMCGMQPTTYNAPYVRRGEGRPWA